MKSCYYVLKRIALCLLVWDILIILGWEKSYFRDGRISRRRKCFLEMRKFAAGSGKKSPPLPTSSKNEPTSHPAQYLDDFEQSTQKFSNIQGKDVVVCREFKIDAQKSFEFLGSFRSLSQLPSYPLPEIAFIGRSNVGKSSLINCLTNMNKKLVITSKTPGRTQGINMIRCSDKEGDICLFADLPGYGYAKVSKDIQADISQFVNEYLIHRDRLHLCIVLIDARRDPLESDYNTLKNLAQNGIPFAIILTKSDLVKKNDLPKIVEKIRNLYALPENQPIVFSATAGVGRRAIWSTIKKAILETTDDIEEELEEKQLRRSEKIG